MLLYQDETHVRAYQSLHVTWSEVGKQKQVPTYGHHAGVTLFGTLNAMTGEVLHQTSSSCKQEDFLSFLQVGGEPLQRSADCHGDGQCQNSSFSTHSGFYRQKRTDPFDLSTALFT